MNDTEMVLETQQDRVNFLVDVMNDSTKTEILSKYRLDDNRLNMLKTSLLTELKERLERITSSNIAMHFFQEKKKGKQTSLFFKDLGISMDQMNFIYKIINGTMLPTYTIIYLMRDTVRPAWWFYNEGDILPKEIEYKKTPIRYKGKSTMSKNMETPTLGHIYMEQLKLAKCCNKFCLDHNISYCERGNYFTMRTDSRTGKKKYPSKPSFSIIDRLKDVINPDWFFIYPKEVEKSVVKEVLDQARLEIEKRSGNSS